MHKFELGQEVRVVSDRLGQGTHGKLAKIIALHIKSKEYYCDEYTVVIQGKYDRQYGKPKFKKIKASEGDLVAVKTVTAFCYEEIQTGKMQWFSEELEWDDAVHLKRRKEMDFKRVL